MKFLKRDLVRREIYYVDDDGTERSAGLLGVIYESDYTELTAYDAGEREPVYLYGYAEPGPKLCQCLLRKEEARQLLEMSIERILGCCGLLDEKEWRCAYETQC